MCPHEVPSLGSTALFLPYQLSLHPCSTPAPLATTIHAEGISRVVGSPCPSAISPWEIFLIPVAIMFVFMLMTLQFISPVPRHRVGFTRKQMVCSHGMQAKTVYKHVGSFKKANEISTVGSQAHPRTGGAKEGRGHRTLLSYGIGVNVKCLAQHGKWGMGYQHPSSLFPPPRAPEVKLTRNREG